MYKKSTKITFIVFSLTFLFLQSCDCPLQETNLSKICNLREATITKFHPFGTVVSDTLQSGEIVNTFVPDSLYSIHSFQFPFDMSSSGLLVNDDRFRSSSTITIEKIPFSDGSRYFLAALDNYPTNDDMKGDILVYDVASDFSFAWLRIAGEISILNQKFTSENSQEFCQFVENLTRDTALISNLKANRKLFGEGTGIDSVMNLSNANLFVLDLNDRIVQNIPPLQIDVDKIREKLSAKKAVNIRITVGDVFLYRALNGKYFIFAVTDIREGTLLPNKRRVTIMFSEI